ncbi:hypothetical protein HYV58_00285 [Candidatus Peregrinibacteria bacterium]|nr:hypothetical protein [Candidatus Peregrinibacteria bacterium]
MISASPSLSSEKKSEFLAVAPKLTDAEQSRLVAIFEKEQMQMQNARDSHLVAEENMMSEFALMLPSLTKFL